MLLAQTVKVVVEVEEMRRSDKRGQIEEGEN